MHSQYFDLIGYGYLFCILDFTKLICSMEFSSHINCIALNVSATDCDLHQWYGYKGVCVGCYIQVCESLFYE